MIYSYMYAGENKAYANKKPQEDTGFTCTRYFGRSAVKFIPLSGNGFFLYEDENSPDFVLVRNRGMVIGQKTYTEAQAIQWVEEGIVDD